MAMVSLRHVNRGFTRGSVFDLKTLLNIMTLLIDVSLSIIYTTSGGGTTKVECFADALVPSYDQEVPLPKTQILSMYFTH